MAVKGPLCLCGCCIGYCCRHEAEGISWESSELTSFRASNKQNNHFVCVLKIKCHVFPGVLGFNYSSRGASPLGGSSVAKLKIARLFEQRNIFPSSTTFQKDVPESRSGE